MDKEVVGTGKKFCTLAETLGWIQQRLTVPPSIEKGGSGVPVRILGCRDPADPSLPRETLGRGASAPTPAGQSQSGVQGPPGHEWVSLPRGGQGQLGRGASWGWAMRPRLFVRNAGAGGCGSR